MIIKTYFKKMMVKQWLVSSLLLAASWLVMPVYGQQDSIVLTGQVMGGYDGQPLRDVVVSVPGSEASAQTDKDGRYRITISPTAAEAVFWTPGYYSATVPILDRTELVVTLIPDTRVKYYGGEPLANPLHKGSPALYERDFRKGSISLEQALQGEFAGLNVVNKGGMPGSGGVLRYRGIRSLVADNAPLVVLNGMPYLPDEGVSPVIGGYSASPYNALHLRDIHHVRLLSGAETAAYGSLGSNGVLLIETAAPEDMETVIEFSGHYGVANNTVTLPVLQSSDFKSYIGDVGLTQFDDMGEMLAKFPFLRDDPDYYYNFLYNSNNDWQSMVYRPAFTTDNHLRVKGGDAIAKYNLSLGVTNQGGVLDNSQQTRYSTRLNAAIALGRQFELLGTVGLTYQIGEVHEQGMLQATSPLMAALAKAPILSAYTKDEYNNELPAYDIVRQFDISNPLAVLNTTSMRSDLYDVFVNAGVNYRPNQFWTLNTTLGLYSNYTRQSAFIPGLTSGAIVPLQEGVALNTSRAGSGQTTNLYYRLGAQYEKQFGLNRLEGGGGYHFLMARREFDAGYGRNTSSDFYRTLSYVNAAGRRFWGYNEPWNWMSTYAYGRYEWNSQLLVSAFVSVDGSSATGAAAQRFGVFPGVEARWKVANSVAREQAGWLDQLDLRASYAWTGNSRFSAKFSNPSYTSQVYRQLSGIVIANVPNDQLTSEENLSLEAGLDFGLFNRRVTGSVSYFDTKSKGLLLPEQVSVSAGLPFRYVNGAQINSNGVEVELTAAVLEKQDYGIVVGASLSTYRSRVESLGGDQMHLTELSDGVAVQTAVGQAPYLFYGYVANEVFPSAEAAGAAGLADYKGTAFGAGDIRFTDHDGNNVIDRDDRVVIGDPNPDFFGGAFAQLRYRRVSLTGYFNFSYGNDVYNAVRRHTESMDSYANQSTAVLRRWKADGQVTDMPRAEYGDPMGNSRFSSRWIEDGSFLKLSSLALNYRLPQTRFKVLNGAEIYVVGENLFTWTGYLGLDPEVAYGNEVIYQGFDYGNIAQPRTFRAGINLTF